MKNTYNLMCFNIKESTRNKIQHCIVNFNCVCGYTYDTIDFYWTDRAGLTFNDDVRTLRMLKSLLAQGIRRSGNSGFESTTIYCAIAR